MFGGKKRASKKSTKLTKSQWKNGLKIYSFLKPYSGLFLLGMVCLVLSSLASLLFPKLLGMLLEFASPSATLDYTPKEIALVLFGLFVLQAVFSFFRVLLFVRVTVNTLYDVRTQLFSHLLALPIPFYDGQKIGELSSVFSADIALIRETLTTTSAEFIRQIVILFGGTLMLFFVSAKLALFMLAVVPIVIFAAVFFGKKIRVGSRKIQDEVGRSQNILEEALQGIRNVKSFTNEWFVSKKYDTAAQLIKEEGIRLGWLRACFVSFIVLAVFGSVVAVVYYGILLIQQDALTVGKMSEFILLTIFIAASIGSLGDLYGTIQKTVGAAEKIMGFLEETTEDFSSGTTPDISGEVTLENIHFAYPSRKDSPVLQGISIPIKAGETIALVGESGSGKTTLSALILGLYSPDSGSISIDQIPSHEIELKHWRSQFSVVSQDVLLFSGSIFENIHFGNPEATKEQVLEAAKLAYAHDFISDFEDQYETQVGERGIQLSGGQKQRVAIARALLRNAPILILDEATSALDNESEQQVQAALDNLSSQRTTIVIAHRLSTIQHADRIFVLQKGKIVEEGTFDQLVSVSDGYFAHLYQLGKS